MSRNKNCVKDNRPQCLADAYDERLAELAIAALFNAPQPALAEIRRQLPKAAPIYEALYAYATLSDAGERAKTVGALIEPAFKAVIPNIQGAASIVGV